MTLRAECLFDLVREFDVRAACREPHRLQIEHPAAAQSTLDRVDGKVEVLAPIGDEYDAREMRTGGVARHVDAVRVAAAALRVSVDPRARSPHLVGQRTAAAVGFHT